MKPRTWSPPYLLLVKSNMAVNCDIELAVSCLVLSLVVQIWLLYLGFMGQEITRNNIAISVM